MNLLYQNRGSEDQAFIKFVCEDILSQVCKNKAKNNSFAGIFVDGRNREINSLEDFACFHSFYTYSEYAYPIFVFVKNTKNFLNNNLELIDKYNIQISEISALDSLEKYEKKIPIIRGIRSCKKRPLRFPCRKKLTVFRNSAEYENYENLKERSNSLTNFRTTADHYREISRKLRSEGQRLKKK